MKGGTSMKVIVVGCGRMGLGLANQLMSQGHDVNMIDSDTRRLNLIEPYFKGRLIDGIGFDKDTLEKANIHMADAIVSCTNSDESNALIARVARNVYKVPTVIARLYDPRKATIYNALGIRTISTTTWGIQKAIEMINYSHFDIVTSFGDADVELVRVETPVLLVGRRIQEISRIGEIQVVSVVRNNKGFVPTHGTILQKDDILYISVSSQSVRILKNLLGLS